MKRITEEFGLTAQGIDSFTEYMNRSEFTEKAEGRVFKRITYTMESILLDFLDQNDEDRKFTFSLSDRPGKTDFILRIPGASYNPVHGSGDEELEKMRKSIGLDPEYSYTEGQNVFSISIFKKMKISFAGWLIGAIIAGILLGIAGNALPEKFTEYANYVFTPLSDAIFGLIRMTSIPVVFLCTLHGILSCGNISKIGKMGKKLIGNYSLFMVLFCLIDIAVFIIFMKIKITPETGGSTAVGALAPAFFSMIPDNMFAPFLNGNLVQIIVLAIVCGAALLVMGNRGNRIVEVTEQLREMCAMIMQWIGALMPLLIFVIIAQNIWNKEEFASVIGAWKAVVVILAIYMAGIIYNIIAVSKRKRIPVSQVVRAIMPVCTKAFITASSMLVYPDMMDALKNKLETDEGHAEFSLPLGLAFFAPGVILITGVTIYFAAVSGAQITVSWLCSLAVLCLLYSIAIPPVSGGVVAIVAIVFEGMNIDPLFLGIASSLTMLMDYPGTAFRVGLLMLENSKADRSTAVIEKKGKDGN